MKGWAIAVAATMAASAVYGQTWQSRTTDSGALYYGSAYAPMWSMVVGCTAPSPQGLDMMTTGDFESNRTDNPFEVIVTFSHELIDPFTTAADQTGFRIIVDGVGDGLPLVQYSDFNGEWTAGPFAMTDPMFGAMAAATEMILDTGLGTAYAYPVDGLAPAMAAAMGHCAQGWALQGYGVPPGLAVSGGLPQPAPAGYTLQDAQALAEGFCDGPAPLERGDIILEDLDGDGAQDLILDMRRVRCVTQSEPMLSGAGLCGVESCSIFFHMTTQPAPDEVLGMGAVMRTLEDGRRVVAVGGRSAECRQVQIEACEFHYDLSTGQRDWLGPVSRTDYAQ